MNHPDRLSIRPGEVNEATTQLADIADRVQRVMQTESLNLTVEASARDEVSQRVAATLNEVNASFNRASDQGHQQLRELAGTLRSHTANIVATDNGSAV